jgi:hypothetical protein
MAEVRESPEARERVPVPSNFFAVVAADCHWKVSGEMAAHIERAMVAHPMPRWVVFVDITGSRVRLRTELIEFVEQSTADQRRVGRAVHAALKAEAEAKEWDKDA